MLSFFPLDVLDEIWDVIESVSEGLPTLSFSRSSLIRVKILKGQSEGAVFFEPTPFKRSLIKVYILKGQSFLSLCSKVTVLSGSTF